MLVLRGDAVFQHEGRHAQRFVELAQVVPLVSYRQVAVAAAGQHHDARAIGLVGGRLIDIQRRLVGRLFADRSRRPVGPQFNHRAGERVSRKAELIDVEALAQCRDEYSRCNRLDAFHLMNLAKPIFRQEPLLRQLPTRAR